MVTEQTIGPCPACGIGEFYEHTDHRWCNACGFMALPAVWDRLSGQAARIAELEEMLLRVCDKFASFAYWEVGYDEPDIVTEARRVLEEPTP